MDIKQSIEYKSEIYEYLDKFDKIGNNKYDYARNGVLRKCLPKILFKANPVLVTILEFIDLEIIMPLKYIDKLKKFKYISWY